ncbi:MAG: aldose 1-epimerase family protein [Clostridia bacterium]|nr:aldose 1-epimerase family protein [Clostridia bacterium]MBQ9703199.1 aldose 1-epimerase family protein [Clostridia bacterium]
MIFTIKNEFMQVGIDKLGAEIVSMITFGEDIEKEYIWQGDEKYWLGHAPIMFPICGRLYEGKYTYMGKTYEMPNHGIARASLFRVTAAKSDELTLTLESNDATREKYPFEFRFDVTFKLVEKTLEVIYSVKNVDDKELIFTLGGHPAFNVPLNPETNFEDYYVEFDKECDAMRVDFSPTCFCTKKDKLFMDGGVKRIDLKHELFDDDAIFLYNTDKKITLKSDLTPDSVTLTFDNMKYIGLWHAPKTDAPYICIEPWCGIPANEGVIDDLETKEEMIHLPSGFSFSNSYKIELN